MLLQQFIDFIRSRKSVDLEELAAEFGLRVQVSTDPALLRYAEAYMHMPATEPSQVDRKGLLTLPRHCWLLQPQGLQMYTGPSTRAHGPGLMHAQMRCAGRN